MMYCQGFSNDWLNRPNPRALIDRPNPHALIDRPNPHALIDRPNPHALIDRPNPHALMKGSLVTHDLPTSLCYCFNFRAKVM